MPEPNSNLDRRSPLRDRYRSRSRSRSNHSTLRGYSKKMRGRTSYSRSRSRSPSKYYYSSRRRSPSRSPRRHSHGNNREFPQQSRCIGIFGLSVCTNEHHIRDIFEKFGPIERVQLVIDAKSGQSRGFAFVYFENLQDAKCAKEQCSGMDINGRRIRVDYSITSRPHAPTPGVYMGKSTRQMREREDSYSYRRRRTPSPPPYRERRRRHRSRSRSYSYSPPRRYR